MNDKNSTDTSFRAFTASPQYPLHMLFLTLVLTVSLVEFNAIIFPPKVTSLNFWALFAAYFGAFSTWFGIIIVGSQRKYTDTFLAKLWVTCGSIMIIAYLGVMYFAARASDSFFWYMWGWVFVYIFYWFSIFFRKLDLHLPEPVGWCSMHLALAITAATAYSIWAWIFPPIPQIANWAFVFVALVIIVSYRQLMRFSHTWRKEFAKPKM